MACERFDDALKAHAAGADVSHAVRSHLDACDRCRKYLARERRLVAAVASDLQNALRLEPSVEFQARIRRHVAGAASRRPEFGWRLAFGAASLAAIALVAVVLVWRVGTGSRATVPVKSTANSHAPASGRGAAAAPAPVAQQVAPGPVTRGASVAVHRSTSGGARAPKTAEPEVLVPPDQQHAIARLFQMFRAGKLDDTSLATTGQDVFVAREQVIAPVIIDDLRVPPIIVAPATGEKQN
jgi:predicted anti-sigma-YlaC factor YlaD